MDVQASFIQFHYCILLSPFLQLSHPDSALRIFVAITRGKGADCINVYSCELYINAVLTFSTKY